MSRIHSLLSAAAVAALVACAGAGGPRGDLAPERAERAVVEARAELTAQPSSHDARLRLGGALYQAGQDSAARATLAPIIETPGRTGFLASLYDATAAERQGDLTAARRGYARYLTWKRDGGVEARLADVTRREAEAAARLALANERALDPAQFPERTVAVAPLRVDAADSSIAPLGYGVADLLMTDLARSSRLRVVERLHVNALLRELKLGESGQVDSATAPRVGRLLGARRMVDGSLTALPGGDVRIDARVADVPSAEVSGALSERAQLERILDAEKALAFRLLDELGVALTPAERAAIEQRPTRHLSAFLAYSRGVRDEAHGRYGEAQARYQEAESLDPQFTLAARRRAALRAWSHRGERPLRLDDAPRSALRRPRAVMDGVNPSPAGRLGNLSDRGATSASTAIRTTVNGVIVIPIVIVVPAVRP